MTMVLIALDVFKMNFTRRKPTALHLSPGLSTLAPVTSSPWAQSCPVQPAEHTHSPVARSQGAPLQEQSSRQPAPNLPSGHSALEIGVGEPWVTEVWLWREHSQAARSSGCCERSAPQCLTSLPSSLAQQVHWCKAVKKEHPHPREE